MKKSGDVKAQALVGKTISKVEHREVLDRPGGDYDELAIAFSDGTGIRIDTFDAEHYSSGLIVADGFDEDEGDG